MAEQPSNLVADSGPRRGRRLLRRSARRTNLGLLVVLVGAFVSGWLAFASGRPTTAGLSTVLHGLFGVAVVALLPWKSVVIRRAGGLRLASVALLVIIVGCLVAGFVQVFAGFLIIFGVTPIQVHVGAALIAVPLVVFHALRHRPQRPRRTDLARRALLADVALATGVGVGYGIVAAAAPFTRPDRPRAATGSRPVVAGESAIAVPATIWLFDRVPVLSPTQHRVEIAGVPVTMAELATRAQEVRARLDCTNGWYADAIWDAVRLSELLPAGPLAEASSLRVRSVTGYERLFPAGDSSHLWLAIGSRGRALTAGHGAPVRLIAPGRRGFWWVKWVASIELDDQPSWLQPPFPTR